jgi:hypothetical protein
MILLTMGLDTRNSPPSTGEQAANKDNIDQAIRKLWSADDTVRLRGREEILHIGVASAGPLSDLLMELIRDRRPRFATEMEKEGQRTLEAFLDWVRTGGEPEANDPQLLLLSQLAINSKLTADLISLLGELRATEGVPILIRIMERHRIVSPVNAGPEMRALTRIGQPAIPFLMTSISTAEATAVRVTRQGPISFGFIVSPDSDDFIYDDGEEDADGQALDAKEEWEVERRTIMIKEAALEVLEQIGDKSVLPFLKALAAAEENKTTSISSYVEAVIEKIGDDRIIRSHPGPPRPH